MELLKNHPLIKSVTPQRLVHRTLKFVDTEEEYPINEAVKEKKAEDEDDIINYISKHLKLDPKTINNDCCVPEFQNFRRGLSSSTDITQQQQQSLVGNSNAHSNRRLLRAVPRQITSTLKADVLWSEF